MHDGIIWSVTKTVIDVTSGSFFNPIALLRPLVPDLYIYHPPVSARPTAPPDKSMANTNSVMPSAISSYTIVHYTPHKIMGISDSYLHIF